MSACAKNSQQSISIPLHVWSEVFWEGFGDIVLDCISSCQVRLCISFNSAHLVNRENHHRAISTVTRRPRSAVPLAVPWRAI